MLRLLRPGSRTRLSTSKALLVHNLRPIRLVVLPLKNPSDHPITPLPQLQLRFFGRSSIPTDLNPDELELAKRRKVLWSSFALLAVVAAVGVVATIYNYYNSILTTLHETYGQEDELEFEDQILVCDLIARAASSSTYVAFTAWIPSPYISNWADIMSNACFKHVIVALHSKDDFVQDCAAKALLAMALKNDELKFMVYEYVDFPYLIDSAIERIERGWIPIDAPMTALLAEMLDVGSIQELALEKNYHNFLFNLYQHQDNEAKEIVLRSLAQLSYNSDVPIYPSALVQKAIVDRGLIDSLIDDAVSKKRNITSHGKLDAYEILANIVNGDHKPLFKQSPYRAYLQSFDRYKENLMQVLKTNALGPAVASVMGIFWGTTRDIMRNKIGVDHVVNSIKTKGFRAGLGGAYLSALFLADHENFMKDASVEAYMTYTGMRAAVYVASPYFILKHFKYSFFPAIVGNVAAIRQWMESRRFSYMTAYELLAASAINDPRVASLRGKLI